MIGWGLVGNGSFVGEVRRRLGIVADECCAANIKQSASTIFACGVADTSQRRRALCLKFDTEHHPSEHSIVRLVFTEVNDNRPSSWHPPPPTCERCDGEFRLSFTARLSPETIMQVFQCKRCEHVQLQKKFADAATLTPFTGS